MSSSGSLIDTSHLENLFAPFDSRAPSPLEFQEIGVSIEAAGYPDLAAIPKLYYVLGTSKQLDALPRFIAKGVTDVWFPFSKRVLRPFLLPDKSAQESFLEAQKLIFCVEWPLMSFRGHLSFEDCDTVPLEQGKKLGEGAFGDVYSVSCPKTGQMWAQKSIRRGGTEDVREKTMAAFARELRILKRVCHHHCVDIVASYTDDESVVILTSPVADMNLGTFLELDNFTPQQWTTLRRSMGCLSSALLYLHSHNIRHKDIKPQNVLVYGQNILLTDFGISFEFSGKDSTTKGTSIHTQRYAAPEILDRANRNRSADIWSLGCVFLEILSRLQEHEMNEMVRFWKSNGSGVDIFALNTRANSLWCSRLETLEQSSQFGPHRKFQMAVSLVHDGMLHTNPIFRPTIEQVFARFEDLDQVYPSDNLELGSCCSLSRPDFLLRNQTSQAQSPNNDQPEGTTILSLNETPRLQSRLDKIGDLPVFPGSDIPQWPLPDLFAADRHLCYAFLDTNHTLLRKSEHCPAISTGALFQLEAINSRTTNRTVQDLANEYVNSKVNSLHIQSYDADDGDKRLDDALLHSSRINSLKDTAILVRQVEFPSGFGSHRQLRTVQLSISSICFPKSKLYGMPYFLLLFDLKEDSGKKDTWVDGLPETSPVRDLVLQRQTMVFENGQIRDAKREAAQAFLYPNPCFWCKVRNIPCSGSSENRSCIQCQQKHIGPDKCRGRAGTYEGPEDWPESLRIR